MKLTVLCENTSLNDAIRAEHGLSLYIETGSHRILFDMGQSDAFLHNAKLLDVDLSRVDLAILSHGHYDHGGGIRAFLEINQTAPVYLRADAFGYHYHGSEKYIGLDQTLEGHPRLIKTADTQILAEGLTLYSCNQQFRSYATDSAGLCIRCGKDLRPENFLHEQYLLITENNRRILISGCSHKGILNIARWFSPDILIGGFHFMRLDPAVPADRAQLSAAAQTLLQYPTHYYTGHCTGNEPFTFLKSLMGERLEALHAGQTLTTL